MKYATFEAMPAEKLVYGYLEGVPTTFIDDGRGSEAWSYIDGAWKVASAADVATKAAVLTEAQFIEMFGHLPPLSPEDVPA